MLDVQTTPAVARSDFAERTLFQGPIRTLRVHTDNLKRSIPITPAAQVVAISPTDEQEFTLALQAYKQTSGRLFPTWCEVLEVLKGLGYTK